MRNGSPRAFRRRMARAKIGRRNPPRRWNDRKSRPTLSERRSRLDLTEQWDRNPFALEGYFGEDFYPEDFLSYDKLDEELDLQCFVDRESEKDSDISDNRNDRLNSLDDLPLYGESNYL